MKLVLTLQNKVMTAATKIQLSKLVTKQLSKYKNNIRKIKIQVSDEQTQNLEPVKTCHIELVLPGLPSIQVKAKGKSLLQAIKRALTYSQQQLKHKYALV